MCKTADTGVLSFQFDWFIEINYDYISTFDIARMLIAVTACMLSTKCKRIP